MGVIVIMIKIGIFMVLDKCLILHKKDYWHRCVFIVFIVLVWSLLDRRFHSQPHLPYPLVFMLLRFVFIVMSIVIGSRDY